jgi:hypothetical protein
MQYSGAKHHLMEGFFFVGYMKADIPSPITGFNRISPLIDPKPSKNTPE